MDLIIDKQDARELASCRFGETLGYDGRDYRVVENSVAYISRWAVHHFLVIQHKDKFYGVNYQRGATEIQDEQPFEFEGDKITFKEVIPVEQTVVKYEFPAGGNK